MHGLEIPQDLLLGCIALDALSTGIGVELGAVWYYPIRNFARWATVHVRSYSRNGLELGKVKRRFRQSPLSGGQHANFGPTNRCAAGIADATDADSIRREASALVGTEAPG